MLWLGLEEVFVFDSKSENRDRAAEAIESVSGLWLGLGLGLGLGFGNIVNWSTLLSQFYQGFS